MIFNDLMASMCVYANLKAGCNEALNATNSQYHISKEIDASETELTKIVTKETYDLFGKKTVEYTLSAGYITNVLVTKSLQFKTPFKPLIDEIQVSSSPTNWTLNANWKWEWK